MKTPKEIERDLMIVRGIRMLKIRITDAKASLKTYEKELAKLEKLIKTK